MRRKDEIAVGLALLGNALVWFAIFRFAGLIGSVREIL